MTSRSEHAGRALLAVVLAAVILAARGDLASRLAEPLRSGRPIVGLLSLRAEGQGLVVPPALYLLVYGPAARTLDLVSIKASTPFPKPGAAELPSSSAKPGGRKTTVPGAKSRTLADVYTDAVMRRSDAKLASEEMAKAALSLLRGDPTWPADADLDFALRFEFGADSRPGFPAHVMDCLKAVPKDPFFWLRFPARALNLKRSRAVAMPYCAPSANASERMCSGASDLAFYDIFLLARAFERVDAGGYHLSELPGPALQRAFLGMLFSRAAALPQRPMKGTVEILNASEVSGVALSATKVLRLQDFDVVHFDNAPTLSRHTRVVDRAGHPGFARDVVRALGCPDLGILTSMEEDPGASVTVELGRDYAECAELK